MAVRFKFRSSANFDSVDIEGRASISVRDLRSKIVRHKNLNICQDFDLVFSDAFTGQVYSDENFQIPSGSSVIIKRIPAGSAHSTKMCIDSVENFGLKGGDLIKNIDSLTMNTELGNFDDFGVDLCPAPELALSDSDLEVDKMNHLNCEKPNTAVARCTERHLFRGHKPEASDLSEATPRGTACNEIERNVFQTKLKPKNEEHLKLERAVNGNLLDMHNADLPSELKCSLCNTFYKEAVMIPCCQHSFCERCIHHVLVEKAMCPKCCSTKCRVEDLLPNLSLREAIERFLESQILNSGSDNDFLRYAPDGESGILVKDVSCALTIHPREFDMPHSPSDTGKGSNQINAEPLYDSLVRSSASRGDASSHINCFGVSKSLKAADPTAHKLKQMNPKRDGPFHPVGIQNGPQNLAAVVDFEGENQPLSLFIRDEADSTIKKQKGFGISTTGGDRSFAAHDRHRKGDRACYMCGSLDHLIRDCPAALGSHPRNQTGDGMFPNAVHGYLPSYWNGAQLSPMRPFQHFYGNPGMISFNATMVPVTPFAVPSYVPSMYGSLPMSGGFMRMGGLPPPGGTTAELPLSRPEFLELQDSEKRQKLLNENIRRELSRDDEDDVFTKYHDLERSHVHRSQMKREKDVKYSEDTFAQRSHGKHRYDHHSGDDTYSIEERLEKSSRSSISGRDRRLYLPEISSSEVEDRPNSSSWCSEDRHRHHYRSSKKHDERRGHCGSDSGWSPNQIKIDRDVKMKRNKPNSKKHHQKHHSHLESGLEPSFSHDQLKRRQKERDYCHGSRHSWNDDDSMKNELSHGRWQMVSGSDEDCRRDNHHRKRKRVH